MLDMCVESILSTALRRGHDVDLLYTEDSKLESISYKAALDKKYGVKYKKTIIKRLAYVSRLSMLTRRLINFGLFAGRIEQSYHYADRYTKQLPKFVRDLKGLKFLLASPIVLKLLIRLDKAFQPSAEIYQRVKQGKPDVVITAPHNKSPTLETEFIKAANSLGIPSAIIPLSWDNLTTKGLINVTPTVFLAWNQAQLEAAVKYHFMPRSIISIVGSPYFDGWFDNQKNIISKKIANKFLREKVGILPKKRFVLYMGSAVNITGDESWLINELASELAVHPDLKDVMILFRPHPANYGFVNKINHSNCLVYPKMGSLPSEDQTKEEMLISLKSAICVLGVNTSGLLDAIINDVTTIAICHSAFRSTQNNTIHFKELLDSNCMENVSDVAQIPQKIIEAFEQKSPSSAKRQKFVETFVRPHGLSNSAGDVIVATLEKLASVSADISEQDPTRKTG